jgi:hypothetical protein
MTDNRIEMTEKSDQGQYCKRNLERTDVREKTSGATGMQQRHEEPRHKRAITSGKQEHIQQDIQADRRAEYREANSRVVCQDSKNESQNIVGEPATAQTERRLHTA